MIVIFFQEYARHIILLWLICAHVFPITSYRQKLSRCNILSFFLYFCFFFLGVCHTIFMCFENQTQKWDCYTWGEASVKKNLAQNQKRVGDLSNHRQVYFGEVKWEEGWVVKDLRLWRNSKNVLAKTMESPQGTRVLLLGVHCLQECITLVFAVLSHWLEKLGGSAASSWTAWQISDDRSGVVGQLRFLPSTIWDMFSWQPYLVARECFFFPKIISEYEY